MINSLKNQFQGINPILNDILQDKAEQDHTWEEFHGHHISDLTHQVKEQLRGTGYTARMEKGLQIRFIGGELGTPESDTMLVDTDKDRYKLGPAPFPKVEGYEVAIKPATAFVSDPDHYGETKSIPGIGIYKGKDIPVAWIELLSPANKPGSSHYARYLEKRENLLEGRDVAFVEIDYLNQTPPAISHYPDYTKLTPGSTPYRIAIIDPRQLKPEQDLSDAVAMILEFGVDQAIPSIPIPLFGEDYLYLNVQAAYNKTYEEMFYGEEVPVDYQKLSAQFNRYSELDQTRWLKRLLTIRFAAQNQVNMDQLTEPLPLDAALAALSFSTLKAQFSNT